MTAARRDSILVECMDSHGQHVSGLRGDGRARWPGGKGGELIVAARVVWRE